MPKTVISVENLSKRYRIGARQKGGYRTFRETLVDAMKAPFNRLTRLSAASGVRTPEFEEVWALKNVSFEVGHGEVIGIIGRNGAGKSTLLKILSRITEPTEGRIELRGRTGSLLEVGTGFHPELTGHENIYLYGAILGMDRWEITRKFDEIVEFAELAKFIDTPVKRYSSGMYMRLAFAVAAHMETEILIVDEVLAVGDLTFQKKCMGKMGSVSKEGRTVLFVSHNMGAIRQLCEKAIILESGQIAMMGESGHVVSHYESAALANTGTSWTNAKSSISDSVASIVQVEVQDVNGRSKVEFVSSEPVRIKFTIRVQKPTPDLKLGFDLIKQGIVAFRTQHVDVFGSVPFLDQGDHELVCHISGSLLNCGEYFITPQLSIHLLKWLFEGVEPVLKFRVRLDTTSSPFHLVLNEENHPGAVFPLLKWTRE